VSDVQPSLFLACVLRGVGGRFDVLDDEGHAPFGVASVETRSDRVRVHYTDPVHRLAVVTASSDETYVRAGIAAGVSGRLDCADVFFARNGSPITPAQACLSGSNAWLLGYAWPTPDPAPVCTP
jgi:hypothetical protein